MGIYESLQRSAPAINDLAGLVQQHYRQKRIQENEQRFRDMLDGKVNGRGEMGTPNGRNVLRPYNEGEIKMPWNMANASMDDIFQMGQMLRETPELKSEFDLMQQANAARQPKTVLEKLQHSIVPVTTDPATNKTTVGSPVYQESKVPTEWESLLAAAGGDAQKAAAMKKQPQKKTEWDAIMEASGGDIMKALELKQKYSGGTNNTPEKTLQTLKLKEEEKEKQKLLNDEADAKEDKLQALSDLLREFPDTDTGAALQGKFPELTEADQSDYKKVSAYKRQKKLLYDWLDAYNIEKRLVDRINRSSNDNNNSTPKTTSGKGSGKIRVKRIADGQTGTINASDFDASKYQKLQ